MKKIEVSKIEAGSKAPFSDRSYAHLQEADRETIESTIKGLINDSLSNSTQYSGVLILHGCQLTDNGSDIDLTSGAVYYQGEIYRVDSQTATSISNNPAWEVFTEYRNGDPVEFSDGVAKDFHAIEKMRIVDSSVGGTIESYSVSKKFIEVNAEQLEQTIFGGNISVDGLNIGIGTASPSRLFDLDGDMEINGSIFDGNNFLDLDNGGGSLDLKTNRFLNFTYDNNNDGDGAFSIFSGPSEVARIDNGGSLGIGVTSPDEKLHVNGNIKVNLNSRIYGDGDVAYLQLYDSSGGNIELTNTSASSSLGNIIFKTNNNERVRILQNGNVAIGTTNAGETLTVNGDISSNIPNDNFGLRINDAGGNQKFGGKIDSGGNGELLLYDGSNDNTVFLNSNGDSYFNGGNVAIGTTNAGDAMTVVGSISANVSSGRAIKVNNILGDIKLNLRITGTDDGELLGYDGADNVGFFLATLGDTYFNGGNFGIGTSSPRSLFEVEGQLIGERYFIASDSNPLIRFQNQARTTDYGFIGYLQASNAVLIQSDIAGVGISLTDAGNVGINNNSPSERLSVDGSGSFSDVLKINGGRLDNFFSTSVSSNADRNNYIEYTGSGGTLTLNIEEEGLAIWVVSDGNLTIDDAGGSQVETLTANDSVLLVYTGSSWRRFAKVV